MREDRRRFEDRLEEKLDKALLLIGETREDMQKGNERSANTADALREEVARTGRLEERQAKIALGVKGIAVFVKQDSFAKGQQLDELSEGVSENATQIQGHSLNWAKASGVIGVLILVLRELPKFLQ